MRPKRGGAEQLALQRDPIAIPARQLQDGFNSILQKRAGGYRRFQMRAGTSAVRDIDRVGQSLQGSSLHEQFGEITRSRRGDFRSQCELSGFQNMLQPTPARLDMLELGRRS